MNLLHLNNKIIAVNKHFPIVEEPVSLLTNNDIDIDADNDNNADNDSEEE